MSFAIYNFARSAYSYYRPGYSYVPSRYRYFRPTYSYIRSGYTYRPTCRTMTLGYPKCY